MTDVERLDKRAEDVLLNGDDSILSFINELGDDTWVQDMINMYSLAFYGFNNYTNSRALSVNGLNSTKIYEDFASLVTSKIGANNTKAYHINSENWLIDVLSRYNAGDLSAIRDIPDLVILPDDINFRDQLNQLVLDISNNNNVPTLPIRFRYISARIKDDNDVLYVGDIVKQDSGTSNLVLDTANNKDFSNMITQLGYDMGHSKTSKLSICYKMKCDQIGEKLDKKYGRSPIEDTVLFTKDIVGKFVPVNMSFSNLRSLVENGTVVYDQNGDIYNLTNDEINNTEKKTNSILSEIMGLYNNKDPYTYNHITGMLELIPIINDGLEIKLTESEIEELKRMVILHDVGKLVIPIEVLASKGKLTDSEFKIMQDHVNIENIVIMKNSFINSSFDNALMHHGYDEISKKQENDRTPYHRDNEKISNRRGYTDRKYESKEIGKLTAILTTLDIYNAITAERSYKGAETPEYGLSQMEVNVSKGQVKQEYLDALRRGLENANMLQDDRKMSV